MQVAGTLGERWIGFLRGYAPSSRIDGMYAESLPKYARAFGMAPIQFTHPTLEQLRATINPTAGQLANVVLTGTAGDGKTSLCNTLWGQLGGGSDREQGLDRKNYGVLDLETPKGPRRIHFIFEFSGWARQGDQEWRPDQLDLLDRFAASVAATDPEEIFIIAANDGKLVQVWDSLPPGRAAELRPFIETLLAEERQDISGLNLVLLNLSLLPTAKLMEASLDALLSRDEWSCFEAEAEDPAFGPSSPLYRNFQLLKTAHVRERLIALADLIDCNGGHVPIREILLFLVNALLGCAGAASSVLTIEELRTLTTQDDIQKASLYRNIFGANLSERRRDQYAVFRHLGAFRVGFETTNKLDGLIVFGADDDALIATHDRVLKSDPFYGDNPKFEELRQAYLEAEEERGDGAIAFLQALQTERQRLFFRLDESDPQLDPWELSVFHNAGTYRRHVLARLRNNLPVETRITKLLVRGLNRIWTGMMAGDLDRLYLSTGLDLTSARLSDIYLTEVPLRRGLSGEEVAVLGPQRTGDVTPVLRVAFKPDQYVDLPLHLTRFEFLLRVAQGALPTSFSKECSEDVLAFKSQVLSLYNRLVDERTLSLTRLVPSQGGRLERKSLGVTP